MKVFTQLILLLRQNLGMKVLTAADGVASSHFQNLRLLNLASNDFNYSEIPSEFSKLRSLNYLNLSFTSLFGSFIPEISLLSELVSWTNPLSLLDLSWTSFSKELPDSIGNLKDLENLTYKIAISWGQSLQLLETSQKLVF
ncbi:hypothetical protein REPUB_Repub11eG0040800 [Reevesia pubescens]